MKVLIIAAHGSRKAASNQEVAALARQVAVKSEDLFDSVEHAFLQFADPLLEAKVDESAQGGADQIVIFPFFIGSGAHILVDIPELVKKMRSRYPDIDLRVTRHLGKIEAVSDLILQEVSD